MALANYSDLQASIASWMVRNDLGAVIPDFITIAESKLARDLRIRKQVTLTTLSTSTSTRAVTLPTDWLEFENVSIAGSPETACQYVPIEHMDVKYSEGSSSGRPYVFTVEADTILFGPPPDAVYTVNVYYYARFPALATYSTNWLLTNHPNIYLYSCLREGALFIKDAQAAIQWDGLYKQEVSDLQKDDDMSTHSGSVLRVKRV